MLYSLIAVIIKPSTCHLAGFYSLECFWRVSKDRRPSIICSQARVIILSMRTTNNQDFFFSWIIATLMASTLVN